MKSKNMVGIAMLAAIVAVLQIIATAFPMKPNISFTLIPIVIGSAVYGKRCGAFLGLVFGIVTLFDPAAEYFLSINPLATVIMQLLKASAAGWVAGFVFEIINKKFKNLYVAGICSAIVCPVVNTAIFCIGMFTIFNDYLVENAAGANLIYFLLVVFVGINFLIELGLNIILSPAIIRIIKTGKKQF